MRAVWKPLRPSRWIGSPDRPLGAFLAEQMRHVTLLLGEAQPTFASTRRRKMSPLCRAQLLAFFSQLPRCLKACATAHCWARQLNALGHEVRLMPAQYVKAYIKRTRTTMRMPRPFARRPRHQKFDSIFRSVSARHLHGSIRDQRFAVWVATMYQPSCQSRMLLRSRRSLEQICQPRLVK
jgi:hypothetical protein